LDRGGQCRRKGAIYLNDAASASLVLLAVFLLICGFPCRNMYFAYKHIKKKRQQRQEQQARLQAQRTEAEPGVGVTQSDSAYVDADPNAYANANAAAVSTTPAPDPQAEPQGKGEKAELSPEELAEKKRRRVYRWKIIFGLFFPFALQALDTTIVASALPYIAKDFGTCRLPGFLFPYSRLPS
jgi:hypothetical protein